MILDGLAGPSNRLRSPNVNLERSVNCYAEITGPGTPKVNPSLVKRPGLTLRYTLGTNKSVRGLFQQDGRAFAVSGDTFFELFADGTATSWGTVHEDSTPAQMVSNGSAGHQVFVTSGGDGYIYDLLSNVFTGPLIDSTDFPANAINPVFLDGYFLVQARHTRTFQWSALEDGLTWDVLNVAQRSLGSDNIAQMIRSHRELWLLGTKTSEVWFNSGDALQPFQPIQGVFLEQGAALDFSAQRFDNALIWMGRNEDGQCIIYQANGYSPQRVSTTAVEIDLQTSADVLTGEGFSWVYEQDGHVFFGVLQQDLPTTWVYDASTQLWHERAEWNSTTTAFEPYVPRCHAFAFGRHLVGDYRTTGAIYAIDPLAYDDGIVP